MATGRKVPVAGTKKYWRDKAPGGGPSPTSRKIQRVLFTLLSISLVLFVVWWAWPQDQRVYVAFLAEDYGERLRESNKFEVSLFAPPTPDTKGAFDKRFAPLADLFYPERFTIADLGRSAKNAALGLEAALGGPLDSRQWSAGGLDWMVLYVSAHGVSLDGKACLLWNEDYEREVRGALNSPDRYEIVELLDQLRKSKAPRKLLLLDTGRIPTDPRLAMFVNDFSRLLEKELARPIDDRDEKPASGTTLWVLAAHGSLETGHVYDGTGQSVFEKHVRDGLAGTPRNVEAKEDLSIQRFVEYIQQGVKGEVLEKCGEFQTPVLLEDGRGVIPPSELPRNSALFKHAFFKPGESSGETAAVTARPLRVLTASINLGGYTLAQAEEAKPAEAKPAAKPKKGAPPPKPEALFQEIWKTARAIEDPEKNPDVWSPVDYAPQLWAKLRRQLAWYEWAHAWESDKAVNGDYIERHLLVPLEEILGGSADYGSHWPPDSQLQVFRDLRIARDEFLNSEGARASANVLKNNLADPAVRRFVDAVRLKNFALSRLREHVSCYGFAPDEGETRYGRVTRSLESLVPLAKDLEALEDGTLDDAWATGDVALLTALSRLRGEIVTLDDQSDVVRARQFTGSLQRRQTEPARPQVTGKQPASWADLWLRMCQFDNSGGTSIAYDGAKALFTFEPDAADATIAALGAQVDRIRRIAVESYAPSQEQDYWDAYRAIGRQLCRNAVLWKRELDRPVAADADVALLRERERRMRTIDALDASPLVGEYNALPRRSWTPDPKPTIQFASSRLSLPVRQNEAASLEVEYKWNGEAGAEADVSLALADRDQPDLLVFDVQPKEPAILSRAAQSKLPRLMIRAKDILTTPERKTRLLLTVKVKNGARVPPLPIDVEIIGPEYVELALTHVRDKQDAPLSPDDDEKKMSSVLLQTNQPNAQTRFDIWQVNLYPNRPNQELRMRLLSTGKPKREVSVSVLVPQQPPPEDRATAFNARGELDVPYQTLDGTPNLKRDKLVLAAGEPLTFPFDPSEVKVEKPPVDPSKPGDAAADAKIAGPPAAQPPAAAPADDKKPPLPELRYGVIFKITDLAEATSANPKLTWYHWVDFRILRPERYVDATATYNNAGGNLEIHVTPRAGVTQPPDGFSLMLDPSEATDPDKEPRGDTTRDRMQTDKTLTLTGWVPKRGRGGKRLPVFVTVDGCPRVFVFEILPEDDGKIEKTTNYRWAKLESPPPPFKPILGKRGEAVMVPLEFRIDGHGGVMGVTVDDQPAGDPVISDRVEHIRTAFDKEGMMTIATSLGDYVGEDARGFRLSRTDRPVRVRVAVRVAGQVIEDTRGPTDVFLDIAGPAITPVAPSPVRVVEGENAGVVVSAVVEDFGRVKSVKALIGNPELDPRVKEDVTKFKSVTLEAAEVAIREDVNRPALTSDRRTWSKKVDGNEYLIPERKLTQNKVWIIATDLAGNASDPKVGGEFIVNKAEAPVGPGMKHSVQGRAYVGGKPCDKITVVLTSVDDAKKQFKGMTEPVKVPPLVPGAKPPPPVDFTYTIKGVPAGRYTMTASGKHPVRQARNVKEEAPKEVEVDSDLTDQDINLKEQ